MDTKVEKSWWFAVMLSNSLPMDKNTKIMSMFVLFSLLFSRVEAITTCCRSGLTDQ